MNRTGTNRPFKTGKLTPPTDPPDLDDPNVLEREKAIESRGSCFFTGDIPNKPVHLNELWRAVELFRKAKDHTDEVKAAIKKAYAEEMKWLFDLYNNKENVVLEKAEAVAIAGLLYAELGAYGLAHSRFTFITMAYVKGNYTNRRKRFESILSCLALASGQFYGDDYEKNLWEKLYFNNPN